MKSFKKICLLFLILVLASVMLLVAGCGCGSEKSENETVVELSANSVNLTLYESVDLIATVKINDEIVQNATVEWSSDNAQVASVLSGKVVGEAVGSTKVKAIYEGVSAECSVIITDDGTVPLLKVSTENLDLIEGSGKILVSSYVSFKQVDTSDAVITYSIASEEQSIAEVDDEGYVTPKACGVARLIVSAEWRRFKGMTMEKVVVITVKEDVELVFSGVDTTLYTNSVEADGVSFVNQVDYSTDYAVYEKSQKIPSPSVTWYSSDDNVVTVNNGVIAAKSKIGSAEVYFSYETAKGNVFFSERKLIKVGLPVIDKTDEINLVFDKSKNSATIDKSEVFGSSFDGTVTELRWTEDGENQYIANAINLSSLSVGKSEIYVINSKQYAYKVSVTVATKVLYTQEDLIWFSNLARSNGAANNGTEYTYGQGEYYMLGTNIEASKNYADKVRNRSSYIGGYRCNNQSVASTATDKCAEGKVGFLGTFDGNGYSIIGYGFESGGLFGDLGKGAVIKNLGIVDATLRGESRSVVLGSGCAGVTIENCYFNVAAQDLEGARYYGILVEVVGGITMTDCVFNCYATDKATETGYLASAYRSSAMLFKNVIVYCQNAQIERLIYGKNNLQGVTTISGEIGGYNFATTTNVADFDEKYWTINNGKLPQWTTSVVDIDIDYEAISLFTSEVTLGTDKYAKTLNLNAKVNGSSDGITYESLDPSIATVDASGNVTAKAKGIATIVISIGNSHKNVDVIVYELHQISNQEQLVAFTRQKKTKQTIDPIGGYNYGEYEYYVLTENIVASGSYATYNKSDYDSFIGAGYYATGSPYSNLPGVYSNNYGFRGVFDGRGYSIKNYTFRRGGLFGDLSRYATVRNVGFVNIYIPDWSYSGILGVYAGGGTIENCYFDVHTDTSKDDYVGLLLAGAYSLTIKGVVVVGHTGTKTGNGSPAMAISNVYNANASSAFFTFDNVISYAENPSNNTWARQDGQVQKTDYCEGVTKIDGTSGGYATATSSTNYNGVFETKYWTVDSTGSAGQYVLPQWKNL